MKTRLTITLLALLALTLAGCTQGQIDANQNRLNDFDDALMKAEYDGHSYIIYKGINKGGITHDPDCPCREKGGENENIK